MKTSTQLIQNKDILVTRQRNGSLLLATTFNGVRYSKVYYDYTLSEGYAAFKLYVMDQESKIFINQF